MAYTETNRHPIGSYITQTFGVSMPKSVNRSYARYTEEAITLFSRLIRAARLEKKLSAQEVADRAGISKSML
jgi:DNA-binding transcriptional regulator YiaG